MSKNNHSSSLFEGVASAISAKYLANIKIMTAKQGSRPTFDELMVQLKEMEQELTKHGVQFIEEMKLKTGKKKDVITDELKAIIEKTIEDFVKQL